MSGHAVRQKFMEEFRDLTGSTRLVSGAILVSYLLQIMAAMGLGYWLVQQPLSGLTGLGIGSVMFFIGTRLRGINNIQHECSHFAFTERREDNLLFGKICASLLLGCFRTYRYEHMSHHAHCGDYEKDLDLQQSRVFRFEDRVTPLTILRNFLTPLVGLHFRRLPSYDLTATDGKMFRLLKIGLIAAAIGALAIDPLAALLLVWLPFLWVYSAINYWTECIDHAGLLGPEDDLESSRNFVLPKPLRVIFFPRNDCYHLIHHLFPQLPVRHLDTCHERLLTHPAYRERELGARAADNAGKKWIPTGEAGERATL
jgi:fatty acid desaturase